MSEKNIKIFLNDLYYIGNISYKFIVNSFLINQYNQEEEINNLKLELEAEKKKNKELLITINQCVLFV